MATYATVNETIWPTANDVDPTVGSGKLLLELRLTPWRLGAERNYVISGFKVPLSSANLDLSVPTGVAFINGYYVSIPGSTTITTVDSTNFLYLALVRDGNNKVTGAVFDRLSSANDVPDYCLIAVLIASGGVLTATIDCRLPMPHNYLTPTSFATGSSYTMEAATLFPSNGSQGGIHYYQAVRIMAGVTLTSTRDLFCLIADRVIEIAGTIVTTGQGQDGGGGGEPAVEGGPGTDQPGGGGGGDGASTGNNGGSAILNGIPTQQGGVAGVGNGGNGTPVSGVDMLKGIDLLTSLGGGAGGGGGRGSSGGQGGNGGGTIVLIAPIIILRSTAQLVTGGLAGGNSSGVNAGGGGGGGAGNIWIKCRKGWFTNEGATIAQIGGAGGNLSGSGGNGGNGGAGAMQIIEVY